MSNFIRELEITNFKSIRHQKIEGCKRINVFIGYPNVGKSNVLEALSLLVYLEGRHRDNMHVSDLVRFNDSFHLLFFDGNKEQPAVLQYDTNNRVVLTYKSRNDLQFTHQVRSEAKKAVEWDDKGGIDFQRGYKFGNNQESNAWKSLDVRKYVFPQRGHFNQEGGLYLNAPSGGNLFFTIETKPELRKEVGSLFAPYKLKLLFNKSDEYGFSAMKLLDAETYFSIPFSQIADTLQRLIFFKAAIASNKDSILLLEEPEAHMFPPYIKTLTWDVISSKTNQFFIATYSPFVLDTLLEEAPDEVVIYLVDYKEGETRINRLSDEDIKEVRDYGVDLFFNLESYLSHGQGDSA